MSETNRVAAILGDSKLLQAGAADVTRVRDRTRRRRLLRAILLVTALDLYLANRYWHARPLHFGLPNLPPDWGLYAPGLLLVLIFGIVLIVPVIASSRSPHVKIRPEHIEVGLSDVRGLDGLVDEVIRSLNVFLGYATFREVLGGTPRRGILFEGPPGTGKTYLAKAMAKQASVPFLFASAPAFQSMWFGMTNVKIRAFFKAVRKAARKEGGAIGFIEEIDAIGSDRGGLSMDASPAAPSPRAIARFVSPGTSGMVNELLIQMQSFDQPLWRERALARIAEWLNGYLPEGRSIRVGKPRYHNVLVIAATNRAAALDAALLRPGRFDRQLYFDMPTKQGRRDLIDFFLARKAHLSDMDDEQVRERLAHDTLGYTPVMIEHLFDEALLVALRGGRDGMNLSDVYEAKLNEEIGVAQAVVYTEAERRAVATHEAGHATAAFVMGTGRRLEVLSIIKRRSSLGLLAHAEVEERFTQSKSELEAMVAIALGGMAAEELFLGESGSGPGSDLATATETAALMVGALGMAGSLISYEAVAEGLMSRKNLVGKVLGDGEARARVERLLQEQKERVRTVLSENRDVVDALRDALIERDELVGEEIVAVIHQALARREPVIDLTDEPTASPAAD
ncbi:MAG: AAA family ATPase [Actinobacteria bacterium]|nr:MAG: AAA family ATPase [Actinomycetota bacterium]